MQTRFIEDLSKLTILANYPGCQIAQTVDGEFLLISENLATTIHPGLLNAEGFFKDKDQGNEIQQRFLRIFNPFKPELYEAERQDLIDFPHFANEFKRSEIRWYRKVYRPQNGEVSALDRHHFEANRDFYVVSIQYPWLGINVTQQFGLKLVSWGAYGSRLSTGTSPEPSDKYQDFLTALQQLKVESSVPFQLKELVKNKNAELIEKKEREIQEAADKSKRKEIIGLILKANPFVYFKAYIAELDRQGKRNDFEAQKKVAAFSPFINAINVEMTAKQFKTWLRQLFNFSEHFQGNFKPRPGFFGEAKTREETGCYTKLVDLKASVQAIVKNDGYSLAPMLNASQRPSGP